jgi:heterodisulfide reductase subunit A
LYYQQARELGVLFVRYDVDHKPQVSISDQGLDIACHDPILNRPIRLEANYLVLSTGMRPHPSSTSLAEAFKLTRNEDGFFLEAHVKLRPVDVPTEGIFIAGLAHGPKTVDETVSQALAASGRAGRLLSKPTIEVSGLIAKHNRDLCMSCLSCVRICPFGAPFIDEDGRVSHNEVKCMGCGLCASVCPSKAFQINNFRDDQIMAMIDSLASTQ